MIKKYLHRVFIDGLSGMAMGLFATLIVGTIIQQIGTLIGGQIGDLIFLVGKVAAAVTCAGIGVGVAHKFQESSLVVLSAATCGMIGGYASKLELYFLMVLLYWLVLENLWAPLSQLMWELKSVI